MDFYLRQTESLLRRAVKRGGAAKAACLLENFTKNGHEHVCTTLIQRHGQTYDVYQRLVDLGLLRSFPKKTTKKQKSWPH